MQDWDLVVIDNGSTDGTVALLERELRELSQFRTKMRKELRYEFVRNAENCGFAGGHNQAMRVTSEELRVKSPPDYVQLLNQDTVLAPDYLEQLIAFMDRTPQCGAAQGALLRWDFSKVTAGKGDGRTDLVDTLGLRVLRNRRVVEARTGEQLATRNSQLATPIEVFGVSGALPMYRMAALQDVALQKSEVRSQKSEVEIFDEDFFSYKEDVDLAFRLRSRGWRAFIVPHACAWHDRTTAGPRELTDAAAVDLRRSKSHLVRYHSYKNHLFVLLKNEHLANLVRHWPWIGWYELRKLAYVLIRERDTLRALREVCTRFPIMRAKRRAIMAGWRVEPAEVRKWFR